jgi:hypothetical protein
MMRRRPLGASRGPARGRARSRAGTGSRVLVMSLQPGPEDRPDDSALASQEDQPDAAPADAAPGPAAPPPAPAGDAWTAPPPPAAAPPPGGGGASPPAPPPPGFPPPGSGYPPQAGQGGFPPPGSGYPPPGSGYPPPAGQGGFPPPPPAAWGQGQAAAQPPAGQPGYGSWPAYPPQQPAQTEGKAIVGLILAIGSFVVCPLVLAIVALVLAGQSNRAIDASGGRLEGRGINTATRVISWLNIALTVLAIIGGVIVLVAVANNPEFWDQFENLPSTDTQF